MLLPLVAQDALPYEIQVIDGVEYYVYPVKQSEGLYRISVNFGVTQEELVRINPEIKDGLKEGQILFIPKKTLQTNKEEQATTSTQPKANTSRMSAEVIAASLGGGTTPHSSVSDAATSTSAQSSLEGNPNFYYHRVEKQQTLYSLSKHYGVRQEDIVRYNPDAASGLREGEVLRIPKPEEIYQDRKEAKQQQDLTVKHLIHRVEPKETLYSISRKYEVEVDDILKMNPGMEILSIGQELKIPYYAALMATDTVDGKVRTFVDWDKLQGDTAVAVTRHLRIALMLPFVFDNPDDPNLTRFVDFYGGVVKALQEAKAFGISADVYTYDTGKTPERMREIFASDPLLKKVDLIIGPAYSSQVPVAAAFALRYQVKTLIPFTSKVDDIEQNPYLFQFNPGMEAEIELLDSMFSTCLNDVHCIFADLQYVPSTDEGAILSAQIKAMLDKRGREYTTLSITGAGDGLFNSAAVQYKRNLVIFNTDQFQVVQPYFAALHLAARSHDILLFKRYGWKNQPILLPAGVNVSAFRAETDMPGLDTYDENFAQLLGWSALSRNPRYDLLGYDLLNYFIRLLTSGYRFDDKLELDVYEEGLQSQFHFKRASTGSGFVNQQVYWDDSREK